MTKVAILPIPTQGGGVGYCAIAGDKRSQGDTVGAALDGLTAQLSEEETRALVVVQSGRPDRFFGAAQQQRLSELMTRWQSVREQGKDLSAADRAELEALIEAELRASGDRAAALADELDQ
jgi:hypothetical protein